MLNPQNTEIDIPDPMLDVALKYNKIGIPVFPCRAGEEEIADPQTGELFTLGAKGPLTVNGFHSATIMPRIIGEFWKRNPGALIGIPTGEKLGAWVLDIDMHRDENGETIDGFAALSALEAKYGALPKTATVRTAGGGEHRYFAHVSGVRNRGALGAGLDVRGDGGYVIAAESVLTDGRAYRWVDHDGDDLPDIASAPDWLLQLILPRSYDSSYVPHQSVEGKFSDRYVERAIDLELAETASTPMGGGRNNRLNQAAFSLGTFVGAGALSESEARALLQDVARGWGRDFPKCCKTIDNGLHAGKLHPRQLPEHSYTNASTRPVDVTALIANARAKAEREQPIASNDNMPEPVDIWAETASPTMPHGVFPGVIDEFARARAEQMGVDPGGLAMACLSVCAAAVPDNLKLKMKRHENWQESARIWTMIVGDPSTRKSPIIKTASAPLMKIEADLQQEHRQDMKQWAKLDKEDKKTKAEPVAKRVVTEDSSPEKVAEILANNEHGLALIDDELSGWFSRMEKYAGAKGSGADRAFWLKSFGGGSYSVDRIGRGSIWVPNISINLLGGIQPDPLRKIAKDLTDDGLLQRMFVIMLAPSGYDKDEPASVREDVYVNLINRLYGLRTDYAAGKCFSFSEEAQSFRSDMANLHHEMEVNWSRINKRVATHIGKFDGLFGRLSLLLHIIDNIYEARLPDEVSLETAHKAKALLHDYLFRHAIALHFNVLGASDMQDAIIDAAGSILTNDKLKDVVSISSLRKFSTRQVRDLDDWEMQRLMQRLDGFSWLEPKALERNEKSPRYTVNPRVHIVFADRAGPIAFERKAVREEIQRYVQ